MVPERSLQDSQQALAWVTQTQPTISHPVDLSYAKTVPEHAIKAYRGSRSKAPHIFSLGDIWR